MPSTPIDVLTLGNAIVDIVAQAEDDFLVEHGMHKGAMQLIDEDRAERLYAAMGQATVISGGSGANTAVGAASLGVRAAFIGTYLEGYLWDPPAAKEAFRKAVAIAHEAGNAVALTLSDAFCVDRYRAEFRELIRQGSLDILFANIGELKSLYETADEPTALAALREEGILGVVTRSADGAYVVTREGTKAVPAHPVERVVDTTGAGDLFAAGFLAGLSLNLDHADCARLGGLAAAEIIGHLGARPQANLRDLAREAGLLS